MRWKSGISALFPSHLGSPEQRLALPLVRSRPQMDSPPPTPQTRAAHYGTRGLWGSSPDPTAASSPAARPQKAFTSQADFPCSNFARSSLKQRAEPVSAKPETAPREGNHQNAARFASGPRASSASRVPDHPAARNFLLVSGRNLTPLEMECCSPRRAASWTLWLLL